MDTFLLTTQQLEVHNRFYGYGCGIGRMFTESDFARHDEQIVTLVARRPFPDSPNFGKLNKDIVAANYFDMTKNSPFDCIKQESVICD